MAGTTSVPTINFTANGFVVPQESAVVTGLTADYNAALGGKLNPAPNTPQGQLVASEGAIIGDSNDQQVELYNGVDPAYAFGRMQDAIARIYFLERLPSLPTVLQVACTGLVGVIIPANGLIRDTQGNIYFNAALGTIPVGGSITLEFNAQVNGPTPVPATGGVSIYQAIPGWNTVSVSSGVVGQNVETRAAFELRRQQSVESNGAGCVPNVLGALLGGGANGMGVPGVIDAYVIDNPLGVSVTVGGVTLNAHSLYACVAGGASQAIGQAIWTKKAPGCDYTGNTTVTVYDSNSGYSMPFPSYAVTFEIPAAAQICMNVVMANSAGVPANAQSLVATAIQSGFSGQDGGTRARIGSTIYASRYYGDVAALGTWAQIVDIQIGTASIPSATFTGTISGTGLAVSAVTGTIAIGQFVYGAGVLPGTVITGGGGSSWTVSLNQLAGTGPMSSVAATNNSVAMQINWLPTLASADINLTLV